MNASDKISHSVEKLSVCRPLPSIYVDILLHILRLFDSFSAIRKTSIFQLLMKECLNFNKQVFSYVHR